MQLPPPWNVLEREFNETQDYSAAAEKLADFFRSVEEHQPPDELLVRLEQAEPGRKWLERFCLALLHAGPSDARTGARTLTVRRLGRAFRRIEAGCKLTSREYAVAQSVRDGLALWSLEEFRQAAGKARSDFSRLLAGQTLNESDRDALILLIDCEGKALKERVEWLSENVDPYNMKTMARVLPRLRIYDELVQEARELAGRLKRGEPVGRPMLTLEARLKADGFAKWRKKVSGNPRLARLCALIDKQREKLVPSMELIALSTLCRWADEARELETTPVDCLEAAINGYRQGVFVLEAGEGIRALAPALAGSGAKIYRTSIEVDLRYKTLSQWVGRDLLSIPFRRFEEEPADPRSLINQNITRDSVLEALLGNPKIYQTPGLVAHVASLCRSVPVLTTIAKGKHLHTGFANRDVPLALLLNPCNIPMTALRPLISSRYVNWFDLRAVGRNRAGVRREVQAEVEAYLKSIF